MNFLATSLPLIQAPMAGSQNSRLAQAVGHAGALGSIPAAMLDSAGLEQELGTMASFGFAYTSAASRCMNSSGLLTRDVVPSRHGVFSFSSTCPAALS